MNLKKYFCGNKMEKIPNIAFKLMTFIYNILAIFHPSVERINKFGIKEGFTVIDYGCGPGRYVEKASQLVGDKGKVYALNIHRLAIESVKRKIKECKLKNVEPILANGYSSDIADQTADIIYALDMFHMIKEPIPFLKELHRLLKKDGFLIIDNGHQPRKETKKKINNSKVWNIIEESKDHLKCSSV